MSRRRSPSRRWPARSAASFSRLQFTPDLVPSDIVGTRIYRPGAERFDTELGPIMANFVLADEINRAPAKVQSALLEVMAERHVTIGGTALRRAAAVPRARHAEPDRVRGRLPAARGPARPVPDEDQRRLPDGGRGARDRLPDGRRAAGRQPGDQHRRAAAAAGRSPAGSSCTTRSSTTSCASWWPPGTRPSTACPTSRSGSPTAPARAPASA